MRTALTAGIAFGMMAAAATAPALAKDTLRAVHFEAGQSSATVSGALVRGDSDIWSVSAGAGQTADISVTSTEDNAAFTIYPPPAQVSQGDDGLDISTTPFATDTKSWQGALPGSGTYYIQVGGDRGNATYTLTISIK